jgi:hypothetical protein
MINVIKGYSQNNNNKIPIFLAFLFRAERILYGFLVSVGSAAEEKGISLLKLQTTKRKTFFFGQTRIEYC